MASQQDKVANIFDAAAELESPAQRAAYLDAACGEDQQLRAAVEELLRHDAAAGNFLQPPVPAPEGTIDAPPLAEEPGAVIGLYKLMEQIGEGGMGLVFVAEQQQPVRRKVALKIIKPGMDSRDVIARFEAERQALALMDHPNIAQVFDAGTTASGRPYFVMELVRGIPITDFCDRNRLSVRQRLELFVQVCQAVQHAHQKGIIHRDLKPTNVLVTLHDGTPVVKVIDFGVAKAVGQRLTDKTVYTRFTQLIGTPLYMSPEQAELSGLDVDTRSDIYSLGVLLYELLTGTTPFDQERLRTAAYDEMRRILREEEPPRPSKRLSTLLAQTLTAVSAQRQTDPKGLSRLCRGELDWIVMKALEKDRARRYETASAFAADVRRHLHDEPVLACPPSLGYRLRKLARRHKGPVLAGSLVVLALVGGIIGTTWGLIRATAAQESAESETKHKEAALAAAQVSERDARDQLFLALWNQARAGRLSRQPGQRLDSLAALEKAARIRPDGRLRDEAIAALALPDIRRVPGWRSPSPGTAAVAYGRQYRLYARADAPGVISVRSIPDDREVRRIASGPVLGEYLYFSPDDRFLLAFGPGDTLRVWRVADGQPVLQDAPGGCVGHAFSSDGRHLAVGRQEAVLIFDLATGREVKRWGLPARACTLAFHPDGNRLAVGHFDSSVVSVYDAASGALLTQLPVGAMEEEVVAWHPDGRRLAVAGSDPRIQIWDVAARRRLATLEGHTRYVAGLSFHPDEELLASHGWDGLLLLWHPSSGQQLLRLEDVRAPQFSADGRLLGVVWDGDRADLLEVAPCREYRTLVSSAGAGRGSYGYYGDISPDGRLLAVGMDEGARVWDLPGGRELAALPGPAPFAFFEGKAGREEGSPAPGGPPRALLTGGWDGLLRWPVTSADPTGTQLRLGPPRQLSVEGRAWFARAPNGRTRAVAVKEGGANRLLDLETGAVRQEIGPHPNGEVRALSADGRWAASCGWHSDRVWLWNATTGQMVHEWSVDKRTAVFFTPDSRTLVIALGDEFSFWDVATLQPIRRLRRDGSQLPGWVAFSPDGRLMALEMAPGVIHLKEAATARTVARLEDPHGDRATWQGFTPDGTLLVVLAKYASAIHVWDLQAIRTRLKEMNLDWDWSEFPHAAAGNAAAPPVAVEVVPVDRTGPVPTPEQRAREAIERWRRELEADPESSALCNQLAWAYLKAPEPLRDVKTALPLAEKAVRLAPGQACHRSTLALAYYRAGRYAEAAELLRRNLDRPDDRGLVFDLYFLAMSYHRQGEAARARGYYDLATRWTRSQRGFREGDLEELAPFRAEAAELFGSDPKKD
jgi:serine/threonine protein kinase/WD40 repeat protein